MNKKWSFIQCSDLHLGNDPDGIWNNRVLTSLSFDIFRQFIQDAELYSPEFIIITGDVCACDDECVPPKVNELLCSTSIPIYLIGGNHDLSTYQIRDRELTCFQKGFPQGKFTYAFTHENIRFCMLEVSWKWNDSSIHAVRDPNYLHNMKETHNGLQWVLSQEHLNWLKKELDAHPNSPIIISIHTPLFPIPDRCRFMGCQDSGILSNADEVLRLLYQHPQKCIILSGHMHMNYIVHSNNVVQITTSALCEYPMEFRKFDVYPRRIEVSTIGLSNPTYAQKSLISGKELTRGKEEDRTAVILL